MNLAEIPLFAMLRGRLGHLGERQKLIAQNVANTDTARYVPEDLKPYSFDARVQKRLQMTQASSGAQMMAATHMSHMASRNPRPPGGGYKTVKSPGSETTLNGNSVVLEEEMIKMSDARMQYDAAISFYQKSLGLLRMAARAPGRG
ncbi:flagellar basal body rod protein FlgB [Phenylobacterium kunshanense]|uniref:Flagellar basal body rod protein FlgB n=1 Tax=Phenylobacterium kunshanense TaxID=1445034 RepID=A0A328BA80_9CAUL|nr:flagellar basal body rod protein FlgB [Phenylobacterium kunshanense]RAK63699.1 flagellar basal body rod protein FlgB [Phenylobacterium kunshanense]